LNIVKAVSSPAAWRQAACSAALVVALLAQPAAAEIIIFDGDDDFAPTFVGPHNDDLDIRLAAAFVEGDRLHLLSQQDDFVGITEAPTYVWAIDRGSGAQSFGEGIAYDALVVFSVVFHPEIFLQEVSGRVTTFGPAGTQTTDITADSFVTFLSAGGFVPLDLLPSTGFALADYRVNVWTQAGVGASHVADFAVDGGMFGINPEEAAVPEPATWALMIFGFGLAGASLRRRRAGLETRRVPPGTEA
jgi:hypothetical protein